MIGIARDRDSGGYKEGINGGCWVGFRRSRADQEGKYLLIWGWERLTFLARGEEEKARVRQREC